MRLLIFGFGVAMFIANTICGVTAALRGSDWVFVHMLCILGLGWSLDNQLHFMRRRDP